MFLAGVVDYCSRYGEAANRILSTVGPMPSFSSDTETVRRLAAVMNERIPADQLSARRQWRNDCLFALAKIKKEKGGQ